jgi:alginate O-acetyltransferase complex protein AlgI
LTWVFFRTADLDHALRFFGSMLGVLPVQSGTTLVGAVIYQPYYIFSFVMAAIVAFCFPSTWAWTQNLTFVKACLCLFLLWVSSAMLLTQAYNPFIYFIF